MKKVITLALMALFTLSVAAQDGRKKQQKKAEFTVDQIATIKTKKMTLLLDLNSQQQQQILAINKQKVAEHKAKKAERKKLKESDQKPTNAQLFERKNKQLDAMIAHKAEMKQILTAEQYETWIEARKKKGKRMKQQKGKRMMQRKRMRRS